MNILILSTDGPDTPGMKMLALSARQHFKEAKIVTLTTNKPMTGQGMAVAPTNQVERLRIERASGHGASDFVVTCKPIDMVYRAFYYPSDFLSTSNFDLVLCGIGDGANIGADILHSGLVGMAMLSSYMFGVGSAVFSLNYPYGEPLEVDELVRFSAAKKLVDQFFTTTTIDAGECYNVNIPSGEIKGWRTCPVSRYSKNRPHPSPEITRLIHGEETDLIFNANGYVTISLLQLNVNELRVY